MRSRSGPLSPDRSGGWVRIRAAVAGGESALNGVRPVPAYATTLPQANTSAAGVSGVSRSDPKRSGAM